jgi:hypothetical protein
MKLDKYSQHEVLDRLSLLLNILDSEVYEHPFTKASPKVRKLVSRACRNLAEAYQETGHLSVDDSGKVVECQN